MCHLLKANWYYLVDVCSKMLMYLCLSLSKRKYSCHLAISGLQQYFLKRKNYRTAIWAKFAGNWRTGCIVGVIRIQIARDFVENIKQNWQRLLHINVACHLHILFEKSPCAFHYSSLILLQPSVSSSRKHKKPAWMMKNWNDKWLVRKKSIDDKKKNWKAFSCLSMIVCAPSFLGSSNHVSLFYS